LGQEYYQNSESSQAYYEIHNTLCREYGLFMLSKKSHAGTTPSIDIFSFLLECTDPEKILDVIETSFIIAGKVTLSYQFQREVNPRITLDEAIAELNQRFYDHGLGYQYESGEIIRVDSKLIHAEVVKQALAVLSDKMYEGANDEYLTAHDHYRHHRDKECLIYCLKAFESVMKAICGKHKWEYNEDDSAKRLLAKCFENELIPPFLQAQYSSLCLSLESGVPTVRNKVGGHGQGSVKIKVPPYMVAYLLHLTATSILLLADAEKALK
jgi:hypothetical protein